MIKNKYATKINRKKALHLFKKVDVWLPRTIVENPYLAKDAPLNVMVTAAYVDSMFKLDILFNIDKVEEYPSEYGYVINEILILLYKAGDAGLYYQELYALFHNQINKHELSKILNYMMDVGHVLNDDQLFKSALKPKKLKVKKIAGRNVAVKKPKKLKKLMNKPTT